MYGISLCSRIREQVEADAGLVVVDVAASRRSRPCRACARRPLPASLFPTWRDAGEAPRRVRRQPASRMRRRASFAIACAPPACWFALFTTCTTTGIVASLPTRSVLVSSRSRKFVSPSLNFCRLGPQHQVREVHVPRMRRNVRTLGHVADVAQIALVDDLAEVGLGDAVDLARLALVDQVEQRRKRIAQADAAPASVADVEDALQLRVGRRLVVELRIAPVDRMAGRCFEAAFAHGIDGVRITRRWFSACNARPSIFRQALHALRGRSSPQRAGCRSIASGRTRRRASHRSVTARLDAAST